VAALAPQRLEHVDTVFARQAQAEQDECLVVVGCGKLCCNPVFDPIHSEAFAAQSGAHALPNHPIIFDQQKSHELSTKKQSAPRRERPPRRERRLENEKYEPLRPLELPSKFTVQWSWPPHYC
jgi:hypothetical protein